MGGLVSPTRDKQDGSTAAPPALASPAFPTQVAMLFATTLPATAVQSTLRLAVPKTVGRRILWPYVIGFAVLHTLSLLGFVPWLFSWTGLLLVPLGNYVFTSIGIGLCFHRTLTHGGLTMPKWLEHFFAILGMCSLMDSPARWVAIHRLHHQHSDEQPDPHTPLVSFLWGHVGWLLVENRQLSTLETFDRYARDILRDPFYRRVERYHLWAVYYAVHAILFFAAGFLYGWLTVDLAEGLRFGSSVFLWGVVIRTVYTWHVTWAVNSITHMVGYRNYETKDNSRNEWLTALATNGEGWHNNHHAFPVSAAHGHRWWEIDITYLTIRALERCGLAWDIKVQIPGKVAEPLDAAEGTL